MAKKKKIGLVLGGGGARGLAHLGVIKELEKAGIVPDIVAGTSIGAIVGGAYALFANSRALEEKVLELAKNKNLAKLESLNSQHNEGEKEIIFQRVASFVTNLYLWNLRVINGFITQGNEFKDIIIQLVKNKSFSDTKLKFTCTALDINWGEEVFFTDGLLSEAIFSSIAVPGVFPPVKKNNRVLVDGGIINLVPVLAAQKLGAEIIIAVDVSLNIIPVEFKNGHDILFRAEMIKEKELGRIKMQPADIIIRPDVGDYSWAQFSEAGSIIERGEIALKDRLPDIKKKIRLEQNLLGKLAEKIKNKKKKN